MEIKFVKQEKNEMVFEITGATHAFCNILKEALTQNPEVTIASYRISHPFVDKITFLIEAKEPKKALKNAISSIRKTNEAFKKIAKDI